VLARSATLALKPQDFVQAARALGASHGRILGSHVLPNIAPTLAVQASLSLSIVILVGAGLLVGWRTHTDVLHVATGFFLLFAFCAVVGGLRFVRRLFAAPSLAKYVGTEILPGSHVETDEELLEVRNFGETTLKRLPHPPALLPLQRWAAQLSFARAISSGLYRNARNT
jgi:hypothetical protein